MVKETEVYAHNMKTNADKLCTKTLDKIVQIINEKKSARKVYADEKVRLESEYNKVRSTCTPIMNCYILSWNIIA